MAQLQPLLVKRSPSTGPLCRTPLPSASTPKPTALGPGFSYTNLTQPGLINNLALTPRLHLHICPRARAKLHRRPCLKAHLRLYPCAKAQLHPVFGPRFRYSPALVLEYNHTSAISPRTTPSAPPPLPPTVMSRLPGIHFPGMSKEGASPIPKPSPGLGLNDDSLRLD